MLITTLNEEVLCCGSLKSHLNGAITIFLMLLIVNLKQVIKFCKSQIMSQTHAFNIRTAVVRHLQVHVHEPSD